MIARARSPAREGACAPPKNQKKSCHARGNCYKGRNSSSLGRTHAKIYAISATNFTVSFALNFSGRVCASCRFHSAGECSLTFYYNMEGVAPTGPYPVNLDSHLPAIEHGPGTTLFLTMEHLESRIPAPELQLSRGSLEILLLAIPQRT